MDLTAGERTIRRGSILRESDLSGKSRAALLARNVLTPVSPPPLTVLPGWAHRGKRLGEIGITDACQAIEADVDEMARHCGVSPGLIGRWQAELMDWLRPPDERRR